MQHTADERTTPQPSVEALLRSNLLLSALVVVALMSGWTIFLYLGIGSLLPSDSSSDSKTVVREPAEPPPETGTADSDKAIDYSESEKAFVLELRRAELHADIADTRASLQVAHVVHSQITLRLSELQTNDTGRRLATNDRARKFLFISAYPRHVDFASLDRLLKQAEDLVNSPASNLATIDSVITELANAHNELDRGATLCQYVNDSIDALLNESAVVQPITLQVAIQRLEESDLNEVRLQASAKAENDRQMQALQLDAAIQRRAVLETELITARASLDSVRQQTKRELEDSRQAIQKSERELLEREAAAVANMNAAYPAVRALLLPFTSPGYKQPAAAGRLELTADNLPLSYVGLLRNGALEESKDGREKLFYMVQSSDAFGKLNDRPQGDFPLYLNYYDIDNAAVQAKLKQAQTFLRAHGEAMVQAGLLSP